MTIQAYGPGCTSNEPVTIFNNKPARRSRLEIAYIEARDEADAKWKQYTEFVDSWLANGMYETMDEFEEMCKWLDLKAHVLYKQLHCDCHNHPSVEFDDHVVCMECGRKLLSGKRIV